MKKYNLEIELFDDWDKALKKEYELTKEVLNKEIEYTETYEEFLSRFIKNILESTSIYDYIDSYVD